MDVKFRNISHVQYFPPKPDQFYTIKYHAGDYDKHAWLFWIKTYYNETIYEDMWGNTYTKKSLIEGHGYSEEQFHEDGTIYTQPEVWVYFLSGDTKTFMFDTVKEADDFYNSFNDQLPNRLVDGAVTFNQNFKK